MSPNPSRRFAPKPVALAAPIAVAALLAFAPGCASTQPRTSTVTAESVAVNESKTTRTTTALDGTSQTIELPPPSAANAPSPPVVFIPDAQPQPARDRGALVSWPRQNPMASRELAAWMNRYPASAERLVQWAHDNPTQVETFVTWSLGHRYEEVGAFLLARTDYDQLDRMRQLEPEAVDALLQWSRRSDGAAEALVKHPRGLVWVATNIYGLRAPAASAAEARTRELSEGRAKTQSK